MAKVEADIFKEFKFQRGDPVRFVYAGRDAEIWIVTHLILTLGEAGPFRTYQVNTSNKCAPNVLEMELQKVATWP